MSARTQSPKVVVSITPLPLRRDSRTLKQASSVARLGYRSIVVEGEPSGFAQAGLSFELISLRGLSSAERARRERIKELRRWQAELRRQSSGVKRSVSDHLKFLNYLKRDIAHTLQGVARTSDINELAVSMKRFTTLLHQLQTRLRQDRVIKNRDPGVDRILSIDEIDQLIALHAKMQTEIYRELDGLAQIQTELIARLRECQYAARISKAERLAPAGMDARPPFAKRIIRKAWRVCRLAMHLLARLWSRLTSVWSRVLLDYHRLGDWRRARVASWRSSETAMFLRHVRAYAAVHIIGPLRVTPKASLYYLHSFYQFPAIYLLCLLYRAKFVYDAHDFYSDMDDHSALSPYWREWVLPFERMVESACMRRAAAVVTVNKGIAGLIQERFGRTAVILRNAHDPRLEKPVERTLRQSVDIDADAFLIVCVGQFKPGMAVAEAVRALASLPQRYHLAFVGGGYPSYHELSDSMALGTRLHFLPPVEPAQVVPFIRSADTGIVLYYPLSTSHKNSLPNGFFQVIAAGLPVMYPELPEIRRLVEQYELGVPTDPQDPASIAAGAIRLGEDQALMRQLKINIEKSRGNLSWEQDEQELQQLLENLAGLPPGYAVGAHPAHQHA